MKKIKLEIASLLCEFKKHNDIKDDLIHLINKSNSHIENKKDYNWEYNISKCDWDYNEDFTNREWVNLLKPHLQKHFNKCADFLQYQKCNIKRMWYQQYQKNDAHGWHIHGETYTGVYYLQMPESATKTELINHWSQDTELQIANIEAKEGDIVIFPSFIIHRSPKLISNITKTIISFNLEFEGIKEQVR